MIDQADEALAGEADMPKLYENNESNTFGPNWSVNTVASALIRVNPDWADLWVPATIKAGTELGHRDRSPTEIFFPFEGLTSCLAPISFRDAKGPGSEVQVGLYGKEDCINLWALLGETPCPLRVEVHFGWGGLRCSAQAARRLIEKDARSRAVVMRYTQGIMMETYQNLACSQRFTAQQRVAAWLLQSSEILMTDALPFTHRYAGDMLGIRRATVTLAVQELEKLNFIDSSSSRGRINILIPDGLKEYAGMCWHNLRTVRQQLSYDLMGDKT
jgi:CRP-like cAMP-binding protein